MQARPVEQFPYLIFYLEHTDHIDVLRILHASRDIPARIVTKKHEAFQLALALLGLALTFAAWVAMVASAVAGCPDAQP